MSPCWWRRSWSASDLKGPATGRPTGWSWDRRKDADGRTEGTAAEHQSNGYSYILCRRRHGNDAVKGCWRRSLHHESRRRPRIGEAEFGSVDLKDRRLNRRAVEIARDFYGRPQAQIPQACQSRARTKAAYRFFKHPNTNMDDLLEPHRQSTYQRIVEKKIVLCPQDTTSLNYSTHPATENLGPIGSTKEGIIGLIVHDTMAFSIEGTPLGLLDVQCWARDADEFGKKHQRKQRPIEEKESYKWLRSFQSVAEAQRHCPNTMLVSMGDREA